MPEKDLVASALPAVQSILSSNEDQLFSHLGRLLQMDRFDPQSVLDFDPADSEYETLGLSEDLKTFGRKYFDRVNLQAYNLFCGVEAEQSEDRKKLITAFGMGKAEVTAALAVLFVTQLAIAPAIATVIAVLTIKLFFNPAYQTMCDLWKDKLRPAGLSASKASG